MAGVIDLGDDDAEDMIAQHAHALQRRADRAHGRAFGLDNEDTALARAAENGRIGQAKDRGCIENDMIKAGQERRDDFFKALAAQQLRRAGRQGAGGQDKEAAVTGLADERIEVVVACKNVAEAAGVLRFDQAVHRR